MDETIRVKIVDDSVTIREIEDGAPAAEELNLEDANLPSSNATDPGVANLVGQLGRLSFNLMALPLNLLPSQSRYHAKNSLREGFMAFKSLVDEVAVGIDESVARAQKSSKAAKVKIEGTPDIKPARDSEGITGKGAV